MSKPFQTFVGAAVLAMLAIAPALADDSHHSSGNGAAAVSLISTAQAQAQPQAPYPGMPMGGGGMMGDGMNICRHMGEHGMADMSRHAEGHIAFIKAELKITPAQESEWKAFADSLRVSASNMAGMQGMMTGGAGTAPSVTQSFEQKERLLTTRLENIKRLRAAWNKLDAVLTPDQRKAAEEIVAPHMW